MNLLPHPSDRHLRTVRPLAWAIAVGAAAILAACAGGSGASRGAAPGGDGLTAIGPGTRGYPFAASRTVTQDFFGTAVSDDFTWLENPDDPYTRSWIAAENAYSRRYLDAMPARAALRQRLQSLISSTSNVYTGLVERGGVVFALKTAPPLQQPVLVALKSVDEVASERVVFDPNQGTADGARSIEFFRPSPDGRRVAVAVSANGGRDATLQVVDVSSGQLLADQLPRVMSAAGGGDVAWTPGGAGLFYTLAAAPTTPAPAVARSPAQMFFHRLGTPVAQDRVETGIGLTRIARTRFESTRDGRSLLALIENGRAGEVSLYLKTADANGEGAWRRLASESDGVRDAQFGDDDALYVKSIANAPRGKLLRLTLAETRGVNWDRLPAIATPVEGAIQRYAVAGGTLYLAEGQTGPSRLRAIDLRTKRSTLVALPAATGVTALARVGRNDVVAQVSSYLEPTLWTHVAGGRTRRSALVMTSEANFSDSEVVREYATSKDGTPVPLDIVRRRSMRLDGRNPVLLSVAGAAGPAATPDFDPTRRVWLDRGGVIVVATLRGGLDSGEAWRADGVRLHKQNAFDDVAAVAEHLVKRGYTQPSLLGLRGRGDGGLVVGAAITQRPELFRAAVASSGRYDLLRLERDPAGEFDLPEFGSVSERAQFDAMLAYSPLRNVRDGVRYPATLLLVGERDGRVDPAQSRKMAARLQQADPSDRAILLRTTPSSGQGASIRLVDAIDQSTDEIGFFLHEVVAAQ